MVSHVSVALVGLDPDLLDLLLEMKGIELIGVFDPKPKFDLAGAASLGGDDNWTSVQGRHPGLRVAIGIDPGAGRAAAVAHYGAGNLVSIIAPDALVSKRAEIGVGCILQRGVKVSGRVRLGQACKLNMDAVVHHDCRVGDCCTLAPGSRLLGSVAVGDGSYIGAGAIILPHCRIGVSATVGAGAVVTKDVPDHAVVVGVPASSVTDRIHEH